MDNRDVLRGVGRAFGGALLLVVPLLMTMQMWSHAVAMPRYRLGLLVLATIALAVGLSHYFGFLREEAVSWKDAAVDAGVALLVGFTTAAVMMWVLSVSAALLFTSDPGKLELRVVGYEVP